MKTSHLMGVFNACILSLVLSSTAQSAVLNAYFGMNFVSGTIDTGQLGPFEVNLLDITCIGGGGATYTTAMPVFSGTYIGSSVPRTGLPDYVGLIASPTYTTQPVIGGVPTGDGETTRTIGQTLAIDWNTASLFPMIDITSITLDTAVFGGPWVLDFTSPYIPPGTINELDSLLFAPFGDIYDGLVGVAGNPIGTAVVTSMPSGLESFIGTAFGEFTFAAASPVPVPPAVWLFGSGLLGLIGISKKRSQLSRS